MPSSCVASDTLRVLMEQTCESEDMPLDMVPYLRLRSGETPVVGGADTVVSQAGIVPGSPIHMVNYYIYMPLSFSIFF